MKPTKASIGWSRGAGKVSSLIRHLDDGFFNHVYWRFDFEPSGALIYESHLSGGVQITPYEHLLSAKLHGKVTAVHELDVGLIGQGVVNLWNDCLPFHGKRYDTARILGYYIWIRLRGRRGQPNLHMKSRYTCNEFVIRSGRQMVDCMASLDYSYTPERLFRLFHNTRPSKIMFA